VIDGVFEVILVVGVVCRHLDYPGASFNSSDLLAWRRPLSIFSGTTVLPLKVPFLIIVIASNIGLVLMGSEVLLVSVHIYRPAVVPKSYTNVVPFLLVVRAGRGESGYPSLLLLLAYELSIVDADRYSDILVEGIRSVHLVQLVLDVLLEAVVEELHQALVVDLGSNGVLSEDRGVRRGRLGLSEPCESRLRVQLLVYVAEHLLQLRGERGVPFEHGVGEVLAFVGVVVVGVGQEVLQGGLEPTEGPVLQPRGCEDYLRLLVAKLLWVVLEVGRYLGEEPSKAILVASVLSRYIDLSLMLSASQEL